MFNPSVPYCVYPFTGADCGRYTSNQSGVLIGSMGGHLC
jgi:hypothetical protein